ncbi:hypothetical protein I5168_08110 [Nonlabens sp. SCSIO 43208]
MIIVTMNFLTVKGLFKLNKLAIDPAITITAKKVMRYDIHELISLETVRGIKLSIMKTPNTTTCITAK